MQQQSDYLCGLDLSGTSGTLALFDGATSKLLGSWELSGPYQLSEKLIDGVSTALSSRGLALGDISKWITVSGPGGFTGLRVAISSLKGFAFSMGCPIVTVGSAEARALIWQNENPQKQGSLLVLTQAGRSRWVASSFRVAGPTVELLSEEVVETDPQLPRADHVLVSSEALKKRLQEVGIESQSFPLKASMLREAAERGAQTRTYSNLPQWIELSPKYFGTQYKKLEEQGN